ncbi:hypothetical protein ASD52_01855 [Ensifer sp. Root142]|uniref:hypothetical protein n=1 Tax=Ensifer sp. Root142 TaxID=1736461 RepID=UPI00070CF204|nr:hypothetical protein [Ensifer sp. Root142]KQY78617.1 hypothetical protein ASD52_01855 [Ensifer sp. Root142]
MERAVSYACDPAARYCECGDCQLPPARNIDLDAIAEFNRASYATAYFLLLLCALLAFMAIGLVRTEEVHKSIIADRSV